MSPKISVITTVYNTEKYLVRCLDSLIHQSYKNIEIIVVNDCSKGNTDEIINKYLRKYQNIKYIKHNVNKGLYHARLTGADSATGDFIAFVDSDDYVSQDFYRSMIFKATNENSDITFSQAIEVNNGRNYIMNLQYYDDEKSIEGNCLDYFFDQEGHNYRYYTVWNKIFRMDLWKKARPFYSKQIKHLIMTEDIAFTTVLFSYATKISTCKNAFYYYVRNEGSSTVNTNISINSIKKKISDISTSFDFVENFLLKRRLYKRYSKKFLEWKKLFSRIYYSKIINLSFTQKEKNTLLRQLKKHFSKNFQLTISKESDFYYYSIRTEYNHHYEDIQNMIIDKRVKLVSFDIFDTLVWRPLLYPTDLFLLMNTYFKDLSGSNTLLDFQRIRVEAEKYARQKSINEEITLTDIYKELEISFNIPNHITQKLKQREIELEYKYTKRRESVYNIFQLAKYLGKKIIITSDMYLPTKVIKQILKSNGYENYDKLYLSSETKVSKYTGSVFKKMIQDYNLTPNEIVHLGDNYQSDFETPNKLKIQGVLFPKASDIFFNYFPHLNNTGNCGKIFIKRLPEWRSNAESLNFLGIRSMIALIANKYFDNPFRSFNPNTNFNGDPYFLGYYALGMHLFSVTKWLIEKSIERKHKQMVFLARDGYLPLQAWKILNKHYKCKTKTVYFPFSRKASINLLIQKPIDLYTITEYINIDKYNGTKILKLIKNVISSYDKGINKKYLKLGIKVNKYFSSLDEFNKFISATIKLLYSQEKVNQNQAIYSKYFDKFFVSNSSIFDVGYSCKPEAIFAKLSRRKLQTYFININSDKGLYYSKEFGVTLDTFFDYKPSLTGYLRELFISEQSSSCVSYDFENNELIPVFEKTKFSYFERNIVHNIQEGSLNFIKDLLSYFNEELDLLYIQNYYASLAHELYIHSSTETDKQIFSPIIFEDSIAAGKYSITNKWNTDLLFGNQIDTNKLFTLDYSNVNSTMNLPANYSYQPKISKLIYLLLFNRALLKEKIKNKIHSPLIRNTLKHTYKTLKKFFN
ncbi:MAG TPA: glycosyltransferase [Bacilli bacterium]|nr:glycosyltransferase [Bacilli bacterium]